MVGGDKPRMECVCTCGGVDLEWIKPRVCIKESTQTTHTHTQTIISLLHSHTHTSHSQATHTHTQSHHTHNIISIPQSYHVCSYKPSHHSLIDIHILQTYHTQVTHAHTHPNHHITPSLTYTYPKHITLK